MSQSLNRCNNDNILLAGNLNLEVMNTAKPGESEYPNGASGFVVENVISDFTRGETMGRKMRKTCIDHILIRFDKFVVVADAIRKKVADNYFIGVMIPSEG